MGGGLAGEGPQHVVGFEASSDINGDIEGLHHFFDAFELGMELLGCFVAACFVFTIQIIAEGAPNVE